MNVVKIKLQQNLFDLFVHVDKLKDMLINKSVLKMSLFLLKKDKKQKILLILSLKCILFVQEERLDIFHTYK